MTGAVRCESNETPEREDRERSAARRSGETRSLFGHASNESVCLERIREDHALGDETLAEGAGEGERTGLVRDKVRAVNL